MAQQIRRNVLPGFTFFEAGTISPSEVLIVPLYRTQSKNGDSTVAIMATTGFLVSYTLEPVDVVLKALQGQPFLSSLDSKDANNKSWTGIASPDSFARVWQTNQTIAANSILELKGHMTALRLTAPAGGTNDKFVVVYGDY